MVELVRGSILWTLWLERNKLCFQNRSIPSVQSVGAKIVSLATLWCNSLGTNNLFKLSFLMSLDVVDLSRQNLVTMDIGEDLGDTRGRGEHNPYTSSRPNDQTKPYLLIKLAMTVPPLFVLTSPLCGYFCWFLLI